jgi:hypothetical protein
VKIAATRTGLGILIGPPLTIGLALALEKFNLPDSQFNVGVYLLLYVLRVLVWALVINHFVDEIDFFEPKLWGYSALGAVWSCLLDLPGYALAIISPGQIPIC